MNQSTLPLSSPVQGAYAEASTSRQSLGWDEVAILLDVDGTIVDIAPTPREVWVSPALCHTLTTLLKRTSGALALVSGRSQNDLDLLFAPLALPVIGGHGAEMRLTPEGPVDRSRAGPLDEQVKRKFAAIKSVGPGVLIEDKGYGLALHYRLAPELEQAVCDRVAEACAELPPGTVEVMSGKAVIEIKPVGVNKGAAVRQLMRHAPFAGRRPIFIGDDTTDEYAFAVMPEFDGVPMSVGRMVNGVQARFKTPEDVRTWLQGLAESDSTISL